MRFRLIAVTACIALSACAGQTGSPDSAAGNVTSADTPLIAEPKQEPGPAARPAPPPPSQAAIDPASLVGMTGESITALFGTPVFVRRDPPGEFWRYRNKTCVLELFFYPKSGSQRVDHIETRNAGGKVQDRAKCLAKLRKPAMQS